MKKQNISLNPYGPPQISDFEESEVEDEAKHNLSYMKAKSVPNFETLNQQGTKRAEVKKQPQETLGQLFVKNNLSSKKSSAQNKHSNHSIADSVDDKSQSIGSFIDNFDNFLETSNTKKGKKSAKDEQPGGLKSILKEVLSNNESSDNFSPRSLSENSINQNLKTKSPFKVAATTMSERIVPVSHRGNKVEIISDFSETESKSESIGDLIKTVDNIIDSKTLNKKVKSENSVESLVKKFVPKSGSQAVSPRATHDVEGLASLLRNEFKSNKNLFFVSASNNTPREDRSPSEPVEGLASLLKKEFLNHPNEFFASSLNDPKPVDNTNANAADQVEGLSSLVKKEFTKHSNEFFVSSLNDQPVVSPVKETQSAVQVEGLSELVKKEFLNHPNEFFVSSLNEPSKGLVKSEFFVSSFNDRKKIDNKQDQQVEGLSSLVRKEFLNHPNEFFVSSLNDQAVAKKSPTESAVGLSNLLEKEFLDHPNEFFVSSLNPINSPQRPPSIESFDKSSHSSYKPKPVEGFQKSDIHGAILNNRKVSINSTGAPDLSVHSFNQSGEQVEGLSSLVKKEFQAHSNNFFVSSLNSSQKPASNTATLPKAEIKSTKNESMFYPSSLNSGDENSLSEVFMLDNKSKKNEQQNEAIRNLIEKNVHFSDEQDEVHSAGVHVGGSKPMVRVTEANRPNLNRFDSDTEESSYFDEDELNISDHVNPVRPAGTIGTGVGSVIGNVNNTSSSTNNSFASLNDLKSAQKTQTANTLPVRKDSKNSFASIGLELYENKSNPNETMMNESVHSTQLQLRTKLNELEQTKELLDELRSTNVELNSEKQQIEAKLKELQVKTKSFEALFEEKEKVLADKERLIIELNYKNSAHLTSDSSTGLHKQIAELKETNLNLEKKLLAAQQIPFVVTTVRPPQQSVLDAGEQTGTLELRVKHLEAQIEELSKDRAQLTFSNDELASRLEDMQVDVENRNEALHKVTLQFNLEKKRLVDEYQQARQELKEMIDLKQSLLAEIESLKHQQSEKTIRLEQMSAEKSYLEQQTMEGVKLKKTYELEINSLRDQLNSLNKNTSVTEVKLISTEKEFQYMSIQMEERQKQIDELKSKLAKNDSDAVYNLNLYKREREEKESLLRKCAELETSLKLNIGETTSLRSLVGSSSAAPSNVDHNRLTIVEKENAKLHSQVRELNGKLVEAEQQLENLKIKLQTSQEHVTSSTVKNLNETVVENESQTNIGTSIETKDLKVVFFI